MDQPVRSGITAVIVTFRTGDVLLDCVDSVLAAPDVDELVLVNHDNPPEMVEQLEQRARHDAKLRLIHTGANLGFSRGCNIGVQHAREFETGLGLVSVIPTWTWQSEVFFDNDNDLTDARQDELQGDFGLINIRARLDLPNERVYGEVFVNNLTDEAYIIDAGNTGDSFGLPTFIAGSPRMAGLKIGASF